MPVIMLCVCVCVQVLSICQLNCNINFGRKEDIAAKYLFIIDYHHTGTWLYCTTDRGQTVAIVYVYYYHQYWEIEMLVMLVMLKAVQ